MAEQKWSKPGKAGTSFKKTRKGVSIRRQSDTKKGKKETVYIYEK